MKQRTVEGIIQSSSSTRGSELMEGCMGVDGGDGQKDLRQGGNCCSWVLHCFSVSRAQLLPVESPEENVTSSSLTSSWLSLAATGIFLPGSHLEGVQGNQSWGMRAPRLCVGPSLSQNRAENPCSALPVRQSCGMPCRRVTGASIPSLLPLTGPLLSSPHLHHPWEHPSHKPTFQQTGIIWCLHYCPSPSFLLWKG